jgi:hypothetical protein
MEHLEHLELVGPQDLLGQAVHPELPVRLEQGEHPGHLGQVEPQVQVEHLVYLHLIMEQ